MDSIHKYKIMRKIGKGAYGEVYLVLDKKGNIYSLQSYLYAEKMTIQYFMDRKK